MRELQTAAAGAARIWQMKKDRGLSKGLGLLPAPQPSLNRRPKMIRAAARSLPRTLLGSAIVAVAVYAAFLKGSSISRLRLVRESLAGQSKASSASMAAGGSPTWESLAQVQRSLAEREAKLREREKALDEQEQRLSAIKQEIIQSLELMKALQREIEEKGRKLDEQQEKRIKELSKIFESAPPEKAGSIIAQTDLLTAAEIIMRIDKRKAGRIWGYVDPKLAAKITQHIAQQDAWKRGLPPSSSLTDEASGQGEAEKKE